MTKAFHKFHRTGVLEPYDTSRSYEHHTLDHLFRTQYTWLYGVLQHWGIESMLALSGLAWKTCSFRRLMYKRATFAYYQQGSTSNARAVLLDTLGKSNPTLLAKLLPTGHCCPCVTLMEVRSLLHGNLPCPYYNEDREGELIEIHGKTTATPATPATPGTPGTPGPAPSIHVDPISFTETQMQGLQEYLDHHTPQGSLYCYDVPPNGDCLFYALVDQLHYYGLHPMHGGNSGYSLDRTEQNLSSMRKEPSGGQFYIPQQAFTGACLEARKGITETLRKNSGEPYLQDGKSITTVQQTGEREFRELSAAAKAAAALAAAAKASEAKGVKPSEWESYLVSLEKSASGDGIGPGEHTGIWGGYLELWAAAALYGVNIDLTTINRDGTVTTDLLTAEEARKKMPRDPASHHTEYPEKPPTIHIAWISLQGTSAHYITLREKRTRKQFYVDDIGHVFYRPPANEEVLIGEGFNWKTGEFNILQEKVSQPITEYCTPVSYSTESSVSEGFPFLLQWSTRTSSHRGLPCTTVNI